MSIFKDWREDTEGYVLSHRLKSVVSVKLWIRLHKWRKQRADRGWSDRDTWGAGDHIAQITAEMLHHLNTETYVDWPEWFKLNVKESGEDAYSSLDQVISDINAYLEFDKTSWGDGLDTKRDSLEEVFAKREDGNYSYKSPDWYDGEKKLTKAAVTKRINKWAKEHDKKYKQAQKAMSFFARHFGSFWD